MCRLAHAGNTRRPCARASRATLDARRMPSTGNRPAVPGIRAGRQAIDARRRLGSRPVPGPSAPASRRRLVITARVRRKTARFDVEARVWAFDARNGALPGVGHDPWAGPTRAQRRRQRVVTASVDAIAEALRGDRYWSQRA